MQHLQPNTTLLGGKYKIERVMGQGGFGITYLAIQTSLNRQVAIKELFLGGSGQAINDRNGINVIVTNPANQSCFDQQKERFKKEAKRLAELNHPNLVKVHEFFEENGTAYYVMDYIEGESLRSKLNREGRIAESQVLKYLQQLTNVLEVTHQHSLWHLDIKPENIMVDKYGHITLIDFGSCKHIEQNGTLTTSSLLAFTPGYYPPEQSAQTMRNIGPWTDIYALGATLYNLLTNRTPPSHDDILCDGRSAFSFPYPVSSSTIEMIIQMMKPNRKERPQNVKEVLSNLYSTKRKSEETLVDISVSETSGTAINLKPTPTPPLQSSSSNNMILWVIGVVAIIGGIIWMTSHHDASNGASNYESSNNTETVLSGREPNQSQNIILNDDTEEREEYDSKNKKKAIDDKIDYIRQRGVVIFENSNSIYYLVGNKGEYKPRLYNLNLNTDKEDSQTIIRFYADDIEEMESSSLIYVKDYAVNNGKITFIISDGYPISTGGVLFNTQVWSYNTNNNSWKDLSPDGYGCAGGEFIRQKTAVRLTIGFVTNEETAEYAYEYEYGFKEVDITL